MKKTCGILMILIVMISANLTLANSLAETRNDLHIIPETKQTTEELNKIVKEIANKPGQVIETYNQKADELSKKGDLGAAFTTGIFNWDSFLRYITYLIQFLSQLGILIGGLMILYAGYKYATTIFGLGNENDAKAAIINAIKGIFVISFSYAILKILTSMFIS